MLLIGIYDLILGGIVREDRPSHYHVEVGDEIIERFAAGVGYRDAPSGMAGADDADEGGLAGVVGKLVWSVFHGVLWSLMVSPVYQRGGPARIIHLHGRCRFPRVL